jgi:hypothetical protein
MDLGVIYIYSRATISLHAGFALPESAAYQTDESRETVSIERAQTILAIGIKTVL